MFKVTRFADTVLKPEMKAWEGALPDASSRNEPLTNIYMDDLHVLLLTS